MVSKLFCSLCWYPKVTLLHKIIKEKKDLKNRLKNKVIFRTFNALDFRTRIWYQNYSKKELEKSVKSNSFA